MHTLSPLHEVCACGVLLLQILPCLIPEDVGAFTRRDSCVVPGTGTEAKMVLASVET